MPRTRIRASNIEDISTVTESEFNEFFQAVVITGTPTETTVTQSFAEFFSGQGLVQGAGGITVITGSTTVTVSGSASGGASGEALDKTFTANGSISEFDYIYITGVDDQVSPAKADSVSTIEVIGMATAAATSGTEVPVRLKGIVESAGGGLTTGAPLFLDASTSGDFTETPPSTTGTFILHVGHAVNSTDVYVNVNPATASENLGGVGFDLQSAYASSTSGEIQTDVGKPVIISGTEDDGQVDFKVIGSGIFTEGLSVGTGTTFITGDSVETNSLTVSGTPVTGISLYALIRDEKASSTNGGTFTSGAWRTRDLNTKVTDEIGSTLESNQFTLPAGTYRFWASCPVISVANHQCRLQNITDATTVLEGESTYADVSGNGTEHSVLQGQFTIVASKTFELQHWCVTTKTGNGFGNSTGLASVEVYASIVLVKVA